jgi:hypothetical protein
MDNSLQQTWNRFDETKYAIRQDETGFLPACHSQVVLVFKLFLHEKRLLFAAFESREYIQSWCKFEIKERKKA